MTYVCLIHAGKGLMRNAASAVKFIIAGIIVNASPHRAADMSSVDTSLTPGLSFVPEGDAAAVVLHQRDGVSKLLAGLAELAPQATVSVNETADSRHENRLAMVRLGMATSLFAALRAKHPPSASHSLRVAIACSAWGQRLKLQAIDRERLEVAALLHDIGKIGIPDGILRKPGKLTIEEQLTVGLCPALGSEILRGCCGDDDLLAIIRYGSAWFSGRHGQDRSGEAIPIASRMLAIADAFDAMTTDHVYRRAQTRDAAISQLLANSGTQFDPDLTHDYCEMMRQDPQIAQQQTLVHWLSGAAGAADGRWSHQNHAGTTSPADIKQNEHVRFHDQLLLNMTDGVIYIDRDSIVRNWNQAAERLTGLPASGVVQNSWSPSLLGLCDDQGTVDELNCPVRQSIHTSAPFTGRYTMNRPDGTSIPVRIDAIPVTSDQPGLCGVILIAHDASQQRSLEERVQSLHKQANHDPLTKVANRAAFDRFLEDLVIRRSKTGATFSLIICDIDHFKRVNDVHGHPAGDEALRTFAKVLTKHSREGDLVARYGGEEFVLVSPDCNLAIAFDRAETIRHAVEQTLLPSIGNQSVTASFGVTEVQAGDSPESIISRADRALLKAKDNGRNQVIRLGTGASDHFEGIGSTTANKRRRGLWRWLDASGSTDSQTVEIVTPVPANLAIDKLRGFIADHKAEIVCVSEGNLHLRINVRFGNSGRRSSDSQIPFDVKLRLTQTSVDTTRRVKGVVTNVKVELSPVRHRDRRLKEIDLCSNQVILGLKSYLMGHIESE